MKQKHQTEKKLFTQLSKDDHLAIERYSTHNKGKKSQ